MDLDDYMYKRNIQKTRICKFDPFPEYYSHLRVVRVRLPKYRIAFIRYKQGIGKSK